MEAKRDNLKENVRKLALRNLDQEPILTEGKAKLQQTYEELNRTMNEFKSMKQQYGKKRFLCVFSNWIFSLFFCRRTNERNESWNVMDFVAIGRIRIGTSNWSSFLQEKRPVRMISLGNGWWFLLRSTNGRRSDRFRTSIHWRSKTCARIKNQSGKIQRIDDRNRRDIVSQTSLKKLNSSKFFLRRCFDFFWRFFPKNNFIFNRNHNRDETPMNSLLDFIFWNIPF